MLGSGLIAMWITWGIAGSVAWSWLVAIVVAYVVWRSLETQGQP